VLSSLIIRAEGHPADLLAEALFACRPVCPKITLSFAVSQLPKGTVITMPPTVGTPLAVTFPVPSPGAANQYFQLHVIATQTNTDGTTAVVPVTSPTAVSDNPLVTADLASDGVSFFININSADALTANITVTDSFGDTVVANVSQTSGAAGGTITLSLTADPPAAQPHA
jgi:hypothetical protein